MIARVTPLSRVTLLLEAPRGAGWQEQVRGSSRIVWNALERDRYGAIHGLGELRPRRGKGAPRPLERLHRDLGVPIAVLAEPRSWHAMRRTPVIVELDPERARALVRFEAFGPFGSFGGTCLYTRVDDEWGAYTIKPSASSTIEAAVAWLEKRGWEDWGA